MSRLQPLPKKQRDPRDDASMSRPVSLQDLKKLKVNLPPALAQSGNVLVVKFSNSGAAEVGYLAGDRVPVLKNIQDIINVNIAHRKILGLEAAENSLSKVEKISLHVSGYLAETGEKPNPKLNIQQEMFRMKAFADTIQEVKQVLTAKRNPTPFLMDVINTANKALLAIQEYSKQELMSNGNDKFSDFLLDNGVVKYIFDKICNRSLINDFKVKDVEDIFFPRKLSRALTMTLSEIQSEAVQATVQSLAAILTAERSLLGDDVKAEEKIPIIPINFHKRILDVEDLPVQRTDSSKSVLAIVKAISNLFANFDPVDQTDKNFQSHRLLFRTAPKSVQKVVDSSTNTSDPETVTTNTSKLPEKAPENLPELPAFVVDPKNPEPLRKQYQAYLASAIQKPFTCHDKITFETLYCYPVPLEARLFVTDYSDRGKDHEQKIAKIATVLGFRAKDPPVGRYVANTPLTELAKKFIERMKRSKVSLSVIKDISAFLGSFMSEELMDLAVRRMQAAAEQTDVDVIPDEPETGNSDDEDSQPLNM